MATNSFRGNLMQGKETQDSKWPVASILSTVTATVVMGLVFFSPKVTHGVQNSAIQSKSAKQECSATAQACSLGIDPDIYAMPLSGEIIQSGNRQICTTKNWSTLPPETFDIGFMRTFWSSIPPTNQASTEGAALFFVTTHWGPPNAPAADLSNVATPRDFPDEVFSSLQSRTSRIEFEVPKTDFEKLGWKPTYFPVSIPPDAKPNTPVKLRGWYIKGDGLSNDGEDENNNAKVEHPLIIFSSGFPYSIAYNSPVGGINVGRQIRKAITYFVASGYDVLFFDKRGHGYSEGLLDGMGEDVFRVLDQLEKGVIIEDGISLSLSIITADGRRLQGYAAASEKLLGAQYQARTKPVVLRGFSYGSSQMQNAMAMNFSDLPIEYRFKRDSVGNIVIDQARMPAGNRGYNFKGIVAISGFPGSVKYETIPYFLALDSLASTIGHSGAIVKSTVYQSMDRWPSFLGLYATNDFETADGAIDAYNNRLVGFKDIKMVTGYHFGLASEEVDTYFAQETTRFARKVIFEIPPASNVKTTTYAEQVCNAEEVVMDPNKQSIIEVPSKIIRSANDAVDDFLRKWIEREKRQ